MPWIKHRLIKKGICYTRDNNKYFPFQIPKCFLVLFIKGIIILMVLVPFQHIRSSDRFVYMLQNLFKKALRPRFLLFITLGVENVCR